MSSKPKAKEQSVLMNFATAGLGGVMGWIMVHPFNTLAVRMNLAAVAAQAQAQAAPAAAGAAAAAPVKVGPPSFFPFARAQISKDGFFALYTGLSAGVTRQIFYATSRFGLYEVFRDQIERHRKLGMAERLTAGIVSGGCAALISCPAEVSLVRMSNDATMPVAQRRGYKHILDAATRIAREEGVTAFWRGAVPFVQRAMLVGATQVATYDQFRSLYASVLGMPKEGSANVISSSMSAGLLYSIVTNPFETCKNRMAFQKKGPDGKLPYNGTFNTMVKVAKAEGMLALWGGFLPYYLRCGGHTVAMFVCVEWLRKFL